MHDLQERLGRGSEAYRSARAALVHAAPAEALLQFCALAVLVRCIILCMEQGLTLASNHSCSMNARRRTATASGCTHRRPSPAQCSQPCVDESDIQITAMQLHETMRDSARYDAAVDVLLVVDALSPGDYAVLTQLATLHQL